MTNNLKTNKMENKRNLWLIPTDKPSKLVKIYNDVDKQSSTLKLNVEVNDSFKEYVNIYIASDEEINYNDFVTDGYIVWQWKDDSSLLGRKKIILSTDLQLIQDNVQAIDDEFLEWFVKNPSCEWVEVEKIPYDGTKSIEKYWGGEYKIIIPKEEPKQEILEEAAEYYGWKIKTNTFSDAVFANELANSAKQDFIAGAKWQAERMYSEEEVLEILYKHTEDLLAGKKLSLEEWFEQFKNK